MQYEPVIKDGNNCLKATLEFYFSLKVYENFLTTLDQKEGSPELPPPPSPLAVAAITLNHEEATINQKQES